MKILAPIFCVTALGFLWAPNHVSALPLTFDVEISEDPESDEVFFDPFGHEYDSARESGGLYEFQMADHQSGSDPDAFPQPYNGDMPAKDFHLLFSTAFIGLDPGGDSGISFTHFDDPAGETDWMSMFSADMTEIWFWAPGDLALDIDEDFEIEIEGLLFAEGEAFDLLEVTATWTATGKVPEPATLALFGLGLAGLGWSRRKNS